MTSEIGRSVCLKGWVVAGIKGAVEKGLTNLNDLDPFNDCDPIEEAVGNLTNPTNMRDIEGCSKYITEDEESDDEWIDQIEPDDGNLFDVFDDGRGLKSTDVYDVAFFHPFPV